LEIFIIAYVNWLRSVHVLLKILMMMMFCDNDEDVSYLHWLSYLQLVLSYLSLH